uniref:Uncharacterized protein n=1 Tax=Anguilla anguilla TaxID=7936 RepID=A0A0E9W2D6_ANGAN
MDCVQKECKLCKPL